MATWPFIARREFQALYRDRRFRWLCLAVGLFVVAVMVAGWQQARLAQAERAAANTLAREHWVTQPPKDPHSAAHYGMYAFKPRTALSAVDTGVDEYAGVVAYLEAHKRNDLAGAAAWEDRAQRFFTLTAAGVLQYVLPLLIVVLAFDAFSGEREGGTLRQVLSLGVRVLVRWWLASWSALAADSVWHCSRQPLPVSHCCGAWRARVGMSAVLACWL